MGFEDRVGVAAALVDAVRSHFWHSEELGESFRAIRYGYEHTVSEPERDLIRSAQSPTTHAVRFMPDELVVPLAARDQACLIEYKATLTPLYSAKRLELVQSGARGRGFAEPGVNDIGQIEAAAFDTYKALSSAGIRVAVLIFCPYHGRALLAEWAELIDWIYRASPQLTPIRGSGTPWVNIDLRSLRSLDAFVVDEFAVDPELAHHVMMNVESALKH